MGSRPDYAFGPPRIESEASVKKVSAFDTEKEAARSVGGPIRVTWVISRFAGRVSKCTKHISPTWTLNKCLYNRHIALSRFIISNIHCNLFTLLLRPVGHNFREGPHVCHPQPTNKAHGKTCCKSNAPKRGGLPACGCASNVFTALQKGKQLGSKYARE